jgi:PAS domain S-box-containing protein
MATRNSPARRVLRSILVRVEPAAVLVFVAHASFEWSRSSAVPRWSVAGILAVLAVPAAYGLARSSHPHAVLFRAGLAPATAVLVAESTGDPGNSLWWWFLGCAFVFPLALPRRLGAIALAVVPIAYATAAQFGVTGSDIVAASLRGGILLAVAVVGLAAGRLLTGVVGEPDNVEERLRSRLAVFEAVFENAAMGTALLDLRGNFVRVNQALQDILGRSKRELLGMSWGAIVHPEDLKRHSVRIGRLIDGEVWNFHADGRFAMPDQRIRWGTVGMSLVNDEAGRPRFVLAHVLNVTEVRRGELELRRSDARSRALFEVAPVPLWRVDLTDLEELIVRWRGSGVTDLDAHLAGDPAALDDVVAAISYLGMNDAARRLFDPEGVEAFSKAASSGGLGDGYRAIAGGIARARWAGAVRIEIGAVLTDAVGAPREGALRLVVPQAGRVPALDAAVVAFMSIEKPRSPAWDTASNGESLLAAMSGAPIVLFAVDSGGMFTLSEGQGLSALGLEPGELVGRSVFEIYREHPSVIANIRRALGGQEFTARVEVDDLVFETRYSPVRDGEDVKGVIGLAADITERERANDRLRSLIRSKDELLATVSHELRTPLTAVIGFSHELRDRIDRLSEEEVRTFVALIGDQATEVGDLVEDLLVASRVDWGDFVVTHEAVDLWHEVAAVLDVRNVDAEIKFERDEEEAKVLADPTRVRQIIRNLITNADRYGGPHVTIRTSREAESWSLFVIDDGDGVPEEDEERIFEAYFQAHRREGRTEAVGLGLTVSRQLARIMDGEIAYHRRDGHSFFKLTLPSL